MVMYDSPNSKMGAFNSFNRVFRPTTLICVRHGVVPVSVDLRMISDMVERQKDLGHGYY